MLPAGNNLFRQLLNEMSKFIRADDVIEMYSCNIVKLYDLKNTDALDRYISEQGL